MKKLLSVILCLLMLVSFAACNGDAPEQTTTPPTTTAPEAAFSVGFGRVCITPPLGVSLQGFADPDSRRATSVLDDLYVTCIAFQDAEGTQALVFTVDSIRTEPKIANSVRRAIEKELGVPEANIFYCSTHSHSTNDSGAYDAKGTALEAAKQALEDLQPARLYMTTGRTENLNFVRHYTMVDAQGNESVVGDNYGYTEGKTYVGHTTEADNQMQLLKITREGAKDIVMMNWQAHPVWTCSGTNGLATDISADYVGACRSAIEEKLGCLFSYHQGASGNLNPKSRISKENIAKTYNEHGKLLASTAITALNNVTEVEPGLIKVNHTVFTGKIRETTPEFLAGMVAFQDVLAQGGSTKDAIIASGGHVNSVYAINAAANRKKLGETNDINLYTLSIGNIAFAGTEYEMFDTNGMYIKENSPYDMTFILGYCNGKGGYIPSAFAYEHGCYEMDNGYYEAGTGELTADEYVRLLNEMYNAQ